MLDREVDKMVDLLVRNYYEKHGTFYGIEMTLIGDDLRKRSKEKGVSVYEVCYQLLGYTPLQDPLLGTLSAEDVANVRKALCKGDVDAIHKIIPDSDESGESNKSYLLDALKMKAKHLVSEYFEELDKVEQHYADAIYHYYLYESHEPVLINGTIYDFRTAVKLLERTKRLSLSKCEKSPLKGALLTYHEDDTLVPGECFVEANTFYGPKMKKKRWEIIHNIALDAVLSGSGLHTPNSITLLPNQYLFMSIENRISYLALLDFAGSQGKTFEEIVKEFNVRVPDFFTLVSDFNIVGYLIGSNLFYVDYLGFRTKHKHISMMDVNAFMLLDTLKRKESQSPHKKKPQTMEVF